MLDATPRPAHASRPMVNVRIKHVSIHRGRPAFMPGPSLKALGFTFRWLRHANGQDYTLDEMQAFSKHIDASAREARLRASEHPTRSRPHPEVPAAKAGLEGRAAHPFTASLFRHCPA